jgi:hypothetical protein
MKNLYLFVLILTSPITLLAQNLHGLWSGTMVNDTLRVTQNFELALSEYRGKITGYTYQTYIIRDTFYYSVKRVKAERRDGFLVVEDVERIGENFPDKAARKVRLTAKFPLVNDTTIDFLKGHWTTEQKDVKESDLLAHLQELRVNSDFAVYQKEEKKEEPVAKKTPTRKSQTNSKPKDVATNSKVLQDNKDDATNWKDPQNNKEVTTNSKQPAQDSKSGIATVALKSQDPPADLAEKKDTKIVSHNNSENENKTAIQTTTARQEPVNSNNHPQQNNVGNSNKGTTENKSTQIAISEQKKPVVQPVAEKKEVTTDRAAEQKLINTVSIKPVTQNTESIVAKELPSIVAQRKNETIQSIYFKNDSLVLSMYDNGIVDGDTVSVYMNGENIVSRQKLKEAATKKTIYISSTMDSVQLVLFAENLGSIPPNTGLLTVRDGEDVYQVRFSADLQKNASIILRRKKDQ